MSAASWSPSPSTGRKIAERWLSGQAEEAKETAEFYIALVSDSRFTERTRSPIDRPGGEKEAAITVAFKLEGRSTIVLDGGHSHPFTDAISLPNHSAHQAEVDHYWSAFAHGGTPIQCGWIRERVRP